MLFNEMFYTKTVRCQYVSHQYVSHQSTHRKVKWLSVTTNGLVKNRNGLVLQQLVYAVTAKNTKSEMDKSGWKWNSLCGATTL